MRGADSVERSWERIENWLRANAPKTLQTLRPPADPAAITATEHIVGARLPEDLVASLLIHDGAGDVPDLPRRFGFAHDYELLDVAGMARSWRRLRSIVGDSGEDMSFWWRPEWLPIADHIAADSMLLDIGPGPDHGQVGVLMHEEGASFRNGRPSFAALLQDTADLLEGVRTDDRTVPAGVSGRLVWSWREPVDPGARWPSDVIATAPPEQPATRAHAVAVRRQRPDSPGATTQPEGTRSQARRRTQRRGPMTNAVSLSQINRTPEPPTQWPGGWGPSCLTFARGLTEEELITRFGGNADSVVELAPHEVTERQASWRHAYQPLIRVGRINGWAFAFEQGHGYGIRIEALRRLSIGTDAVSMAAHGTIAHAHDGAVSDEHHDNIEDAVAAAIRQGPGQFDPAVLAGPLRTATLFPLLPEPDAEPQRTLMAFDPDLVAIIEHATEAQLRPAVIALARKRMARLGVPESAGIDAALTAAMDGPTGMPGQDSPVGVTLRRLVSEATVAGQRWQEPHRRPAPVGLTDIERTTWHARRRWVRNVTMILAYPAIVAAYAMPDWPKVFDERAELLAALADVVPPTDAVERQQRAEEQRRRPAQP